MQSTSTTSRRHATSAVAVLFLLALAPLPLLLGVWAVGESNALLLFCLAVAVPAFGVLDALLSPRFAGVLSRGESSTPRLTSRLFIVAALCLVQCFVAWYPSRWLAGLDAAGLPGLFVLYIAALGGAAMGFLTLALTPDPAYARPVVFVVFTVLCALAGGLNPTLRDQHWMKPISAAAPSRWAFERLILLKSGEAGSQAIGEATADGRRPANGAGRTLLPGDVRAHGARRGLRRAHADPRRPGSSRRILLTVVIRGRSTSGRRTSSRMSRASHFEAFGESYTIALREFRRLRAPGWAR